MVEEKEKLRLLREILLIDDRQVADAINQRLEKISETLEKREKLAKKIDPIIDGHFDEFVKEIPTTLGPTITQTLKEEVENSKDSIVEALYPIMGKMIKRYIQNEIKMLSENINSKVNNTFSMSVLKRKFKAIFSGVKEGDLILSELDKPVISEVFVIQKGSGLLLGNYTITETLDKDMLSGMLTAIKSFVEDAFSSGEQNLEGIEYELYQILIQNFHSYYIAIVISGTASTSFENELEDKLLDISPQLTELIRTASRENVDIFLADQFETES
ncbi:MAG: cell envelope biogenesis protein OmpA [Gilvibacter sp.]